MVVLELQRHPDGVASVAFKEPEQADACIQSFDRRWFGGRQLSAQLWDGTTDYQVDKYNIWRFDYSFVNYFEKISDFFC